MFDEVKEMPMSYKLTSKPDRKMPPRDFGDIRRTSIDANLFPYSPQPMTEHRKWCIYAYHENGSRLYSDLGREQAFTMARVLNERYWSSNK